MGTRKNIPRPAYRGGELEEDLCFSEPSLGGIASCYRVFDHATAGALSPSGETVSVSIHTANFRRVFPSLTSQGLQRDVFTGFCAGNNIQTPTWFAAPFQALSKQVPKIRSFARVRHAVRIAVAFKRARPRPDAAGQLAESSAERKKAPRVVCKWRTGRNSSGYEAASKIAPSTATHTPYRVACCRDSNTRSAQEPQVGAYHPKVVDCVFFCFFFCLGVKWKTVTHRSIREQRWGKVHREKTRYFPHWDSGGPRRGGRRAGEGRPPLPEVEGSRIPRYRGAGGAGAGGGGTKQGRLRVLFLSGERRAGRRKPRRASAFVCKTGFISRAGRLIEARPWPLVGVPHGCGCGLASASCATTGPRKTGLSFSLSD